MSLTKGLFFLHEGKIKQAEELFEKYASDEMNGNYRFGSVARIFGRHQYYKKAFIWHQKQHQHDPKVAYEDGLVCCYMYGIGCEKNVRRGAKILYEKGLHSVGQFRLTDEDILIVSFVYGKYLIGKDLNIGQNSVQVFLTSCEKALATVLYWLWFTKKYNLLVPDLRRVIGKLIWKSRKFPSIWGVTLK